MLSYNQAVNNAINEDIISKIQNMTMDGSHSGNHKSLAIRGNRDLTILKN